MTQLRKVFPIVLSLTLSQTSSLFATEELPPLQEAPIVLSETKPVAQSSSFSLLPDDVKVSAGLSANMFLDRTFNTDLSEKRVFQRYKSVAPFMEWRFGKNWSPDWQTDLSIYNSYDLDPYATNTLNDGTETNIAHAWVTDVKFCLSHRVEQNLYIGLGLGAGCFGLHTDTLPGDYAIPYAHAYLPFIRVHNSYKLGSFDAQWEAEVSRSDSYYFTGYGFDFKNHLWFKKTEKQQQGILLGFSYWDINIPEILSHRDINDSLRTLKIGWEVHFC